MNTAVVFRCTSNFFYLVGNLIINIETISKNFADAYVVYTDNINDCNWDAVRIICRYYDKKLELNNYSFEFFLSRLTESSSVERFNTKYSYIIFALFEIFDLLERYDDVLALDLDMIVYEDLSSIRKLLNANSYIIFKQAGYVNTQLSEPNKIINSYNDYPKPNAGLIYVCNKINYKNLTEHCYRILAENIDIIKSTHDEVVLGLLLIYENLNYTLIKGSFNVYLKSDYKPPNVVFHFLHHSKPWQFNNEMLSCFPELVRYIEKYYLITGNRYKNIDISNNRIFNNIESCFNSIVYSQFFSKITEEYADFYVLDFKKKYLQLFLFNVTRLIHYEILIDSYYHYIEKDFFKIIKVNKINYITIELHFETDKFIINKAKVYFMSLHPIVDMYAEEKRFQFVVGIKVESMKVFTLFSEFYALTKRIITHVTNE